MQDSNSARRHARLMAATACALMAAACSSSTAGTGHRVTTVASPSGSATQQPATTAAAPSTPVGTPSATSGSDLGVPSPSGKVADWANRYLEAAKSKDCKTMQSLYKGVVCDKAITAMATAQIADMQEYGTGAIVDFHDVAGIGTDTFMLATDYDGQFAALEDVGLGHATVGTSGDVGPFEQTAAAQYRAYAKADCPTVYKYATVRESQSQFCSTFASNQKLLIEALAANPDATPVPLGGTADVQFFGYILALPASVSTTDKYGYLTLAVVKAPEGSGASNPYLCENFMIGPKPGA